MKKYATFDRIGRGNEGILSDVFDGNEKYRRTSDWYNHADDVAAALEAKDRKISALKEELEDSERVIDSGLAQNESLRLRLAVLDVCASGSFRP